MENSVKKENELDDTDVNNGYFLQTDRFISETEMDNQSGKKFKNEKSTTKPTPTSRICTTLVPLKIDEIPEFCYACFGLHCNCDNV